MDPTAGVPVAEAEGRSLAVHYTDLAADFGVVGHMSGSARTGFGLGEGTSVGGCRFERIAFAWVVGRWVGDGRRVVGCWGGIGFAWRGRRGVVRGRGGGSCLGCSRLGSGVVVCVLGRRCRLAVVEIVVVEGIGSRFGWRKLDGWIARKIGTVVVWKWGLGIGQRSLWPGILRWVRRLDAIDMKLIARGEVCRKKVTLMGPLTCVP